MMTLFSKLCICLSRDMYVEDEGGDGRANQNIFCMRKHIETYEFVSQLNKYASKKKKEEERYPARVNNAALKTQGLN